MFWGLRSGGGRGILFTASEGEIEIFSYCTWQNISQIGLKHLILHD